MIAVIAILASILFPVFLSARDSAKKTICLSNMNQGGKAIFLYSSDNGDRCVPPTSHGLCDSFVGSWTSESDHDMAWPEIVQRYAKDWQFFRCPSDLAATDSEMSKAPRDEQPIPQDQTAKRHWAWAFRSHMGLNYSWLAYTFKRDKFNARFGAIPSQAKTILLVDSVWKRQTDGTPYGGGSWAVDAPASEDFLDCTRAGWRCWTVGPGDPDSQECRAMSGAFGYAYPWHTSHQVFNTAFIDGHVKSLKLADLLAGTDPKARILTDEEACLWDTRK